jgi:hemin uptake protein HemP
MMNAHLSSLPSDRNPVVPPARDLRAGSPHGAIPNVARISSDQLLCGSTEVHIEHRGSLYRLKQTSLGKLILTK